MSADNGIYILITALDETGMVEEYRVAHAAAIDNFDWYVENEPENLGIYMQEVWGNSPIFTDWDSANSYAKELHNEIGYTEYGIMCIDASDYVFPN